LDHLSLHKTGEETMITDDDDVLMEIKVSDRYPMWLTEILTDMKLYRQTFSKYGTIYSELETRRHAKPFHKTQYSSESVMGRALHRKENAPCLAHY
ncbi:MAG: hypothetical protein J6S26_04955, partial [Solobacterium sp.]|nr:hypothetical protein [Solobacterium sp.]